MVYRLRMWLEVNEMLIILGYPIDYLQMVLHVHLCIPLID